jgi:hypothetical protein
VETKDVGRSGRVGEKGPERGAGGVAAPGTSAGSRGSKSGSTPPSRIANNSGLREGKAIQSPRTEEKFAGGQRPNEVASNGREDAGGRPAVLAARDDRQMEEFRAAKHFNCTGRGPGLYADVNTGCKVRSNPPPLPISFLCCLDTSRAEKKVAGQK